MAKNYRVAVIPGDGIGREVVPEGVRVLEAAGRKFGFSLQWDEKPWSCEHYQKHGAEFGHISKAEYLRLAQELRDAPARGPILQAVQRTGVITKFDTVRGYFVAYNPDGTIRTFFIPVDGERHFRRQARR